MWFSRRPRIGLPSKCPDGTKVPIRRSNELTCRTTCCAAYRNVSSISVENSSWAAVVERSAHFLSRQFVDGLGTTRLSANWSKQQRNLKEKDHEETSFGFSHLLGISRQRSRGGQPRSGVWQARYGAEPRQQHEQIQFRDRHAGHGK